MAVDVKICGLRDDAGVKAAVSGGAAFVGFVFFAPSPRFVAPRVAAQLARLVPASIVRVGLVVDAEDKDLEELLSVVPLDLLQLHGCESAARVAEVRERFAIPVMKAIGVAGEPDLACVNEYARVADRLLFDARPPAGSTRPGGNAVAFDWGLLAGRSWPLPWMLAGGLTAGNMAAAVRLSGASAIDVSSGVESSPGCKDPESIRRFLAAARMLDTADAVRS
ncbi:MAG: phosphoribosylanthranilate isomerase [Rhodospirillales bacterium]|nr:phosphoribosylanthranilate isomerase [Rhodospirillales bacterium]